MALGVVPSLATGLATGWAGASPLAALRGRMLGVVALDSPTHTLALAVLRSAGLKSADVRIVSVGSAASATAALRSGQIDALMHMDPLMQQLVQRGELRMLADVRSPESCEQWLGQSLPSSCLSATADFLQRYPGVALASSQATLEALQWLARVSVREILALLPDGLPGVETQLFVASLVNLRLAYAVDGQCSEAQLKALWQAMMEAQPTLRLERVNPLQSHTNAFVQRASLR
jgi:NitT/TauT family transport system substrate-binding protein